MRELEGNRARYAHETQSIEHGIRDTEGFQRDSAAFLNRRLAGDGKPFRQIFNRESADAHLNSVNDPHLDSTHQD